VTAGLILQALRKLGVRPGAAVWVHSSLSAFGRVAGGADAVIAALTGAVGPRGTLVMPTFTWTSFHDRTTGVFDVRRTPSETGLVTETFRRMPGVGRSIHLCHSVASLGPLTQAMLGDGVRPFWGNTALTALHRHDGLCLFLGVGFSVCTALHAAEELAQVPYRAYRDYRRCRVVLPDGRRIASPSLEFLRVDGVRTDFSAKEGFYRERGALRETACGPAHGRARQGPGGRRAGRTGEGRDFPARRTVPRSVAAGVTRSPPPVEDSRCRPGEGS
jgi:aminoglycoside 3-N-acetyltransferase